jgi:hypothetical protein
MQYFHDPRAVKAATKDVWVKLNAGMEDDNEGGGC